VAETTKPKISIVKNIPNLLTLIRVLVIPAFVLLLIDPTPQTRLWAASIFLFASFTDWLDGYLARLYNAESILGTMLDPLADKVLVMAALIMLAAVPTPDKIPAWLVVVLLSRELIVTGLRSVAAVKGIVVPASNLAKHKTAWTMIAILFLLVSSSYQFFGYWLNFHDAGMIFLYLAFGFSVVSGLSYAVSLRRMFI